MAGTSLYLRVLFWIAVAAWGISLFINGEPVTAALLRPASIVQFVLITVVTIFEKWAWHWPLLNLIVKRPNLTGLYSGELRSQWINPETGQGIAPIRSFIIIRQTLSAIHVRLFTEQSQSSSLQGFIERQADDHQELMFSYRNEPKIEFRAKSQIHYGGAKLQISHDAQSLEGSYWTDRQTIGGMTFSRVTRKTKAANFQEALALAKKPKS